MPRDVLLTAGAQRDLEAIYDHVTETRGPARAERLLQRLLDLSAGLVEAPHRGAYPDELLALGIREYRQLIFRPYRLIYRVIGEQVFIVLIADGRRDMQSLLARRLLGAE